MMDHLPRAALHNPIRFEIAAIRTHLLKRVVRTYERGLNGEIDKDQAPGYAVGLKAALALLDRTDPVPRLGEGERGPVTINVAIVSSDVAGHAPQANGLAIRFSGGEGDGA